eukprot:scaffold203158_cov31-Tisochrysis_lutea.AAC.2
MPPFEGAREVCVTGAASFLIPGVDVGPSALRLRGLLCFVHQASGYWQQLPTDSSGSAQEETSAVRWGRRVGGRDGGGTRRNDMHTYARAVRAEGRRASKKEPLFPIIYDANGFSIRPPILAYAAHP